VDDAWWDQTAVIHVVGDILACVTARGMVLFGSADDPKVPSQMRNIATKLEAAGD